MSVCCPSVDIPYFLIFCLQTPGWHFREAFSIMYGGICSDYDMCTLSHLLQRVCVCVESCREKQSISHTHTHTRASCIWRPSTRRVPKALWEICKLADAHHCLSHPDPCSIPNTCRVSLRTRVWPKGFCWRGFYEYLQFKTAVPHKNHSSPLAMLEVNRREKHWLPAGIKVISPTKALLYGELNSKLSIHSLFVD